MKKPNVRGLKAGSKLAEQAQQKALMSYVSARKQLAMLEQQVQDLERMIGEYANAAGSVGRTTSAAALRGNNSFVKQLTAAANGIRFKERQSKELMLRCFREWVKSTQRVEALRATAQRRTDDFDAYQERLDEFVLDEISVISYERDGR